MMRPFVFRGCLLAAMCCTISRDGLAQTDGAVAPQPSPIAALLADTPSPRHASALVRIRGLVTLALPDRFDFAVQDETASMWVSALELADVSPWGDMRRAMRAGQDVEVDGVIDDGGYAPRILLRSMRIVGERPLPPPEPANVARLFSGVDNCRRVEWTGVVQGVRDQGREWGLVVSSGARRLVVRIAKGMLSQSPEDLLDAPVRCVGVVGAVRNSRGEFLAPTLWVAAADDLAITGSPPFEAFEAPLVPLERIARYRFEPRTDHRQQTEGIVTAVVAERCFYIQHGLYGVRVQLVSGPLPQPGDRVQVAGFLDMSRQIAGISDALVRVVGHGEVPAPASVSPHEIVRINTESRRLGVIAQPSNYDGCLVTFPARLMDKKTSVPGIGQLVLSSGEVTLSSIYEGEGFASLDRLQPGSDLQVTGVMQIQMMGDEGLSSMAADPVVQQITTILRSADDVKVQRTPSWWSVRRLATVVAGLAAVLVGALLWVGLLRRQIAATTERLTSEMQRRRDAALEFDATLRERNRLAANLHDTLLQTLTGIDFQLGACRAQGVEDSREPPAPLDVAQRMVAHAAEELRSSVWALRTMPVAGRSFGESLETIARQSGHGRHETIAVRVAGMPADLPQFIAGNLLLVAQEAIHNAVQHAQACRIDVVATGTPATGTITLTVHDDGRGFTPGSQRGADQGHFGLSGMRERIDRLGGTLAIESHEGAGTTVRAIVPTREYDRRIDVGDGVSPARDE